MRARAPIIVGLSLTLIFGAGAALRWWWWTHIPRTAAGSQAMSRSQFLSLPTFDRSCIKHEECEPPLSCVWDVRVRARRCLGNECDSDADCQLGFVCRATETEGRSVPLCFVQGVRKEGELCERNPLKSNEACEGDLLCNYRFCGRRCRLEDPASCPEHSACVKDGVLEPSCVPSCLRDGCLGGKRCFQIDGELSVCGVLGGDTDCEAHPCPSGEQCGKNIADLPDRVYMVCFRPCDANRPCPPGSFCSDGACVEECDHTVRGSCGPNRTCIYRLDIRKGYCIGRLRSSP